MLRSIQHENIIEAYRVFTSANHHHLVLKFFDGLNLNDYLRKQERRKMTEHSARGILQEIFKTIKYCHDRNLCHRDLKAENIMINPDTMKIKIIDFAYAEFVSEGEFVNTYCGTPSYMSPEILKKEPHCPRKDDIWALGIMSWRILVGQLPFQATGSRELYKKILEAPPPFQRLKDLTLEFKDLMARMLEKKASSRPSMTEILEHAWFKIQLSPSETGESKQKATESSRSATKARLAEIESHKVVNILTSTNQSPEKKDSKAVANSRSKKVPMEATTRIPIPGEFSPRAAQNLANMKQKNALQILLEAPVGGLDCDETGDDRESVQVVSRLGGSKASHGQQPPLVQHNTKADEPLFAMQRIEEIEEEEGAGEPDGHNSLHERSITSSLCQKELGSLEIFTQLGDFPVAAKRQPTYIEAEDDELDHKKPTVSATAGGASSKHLVRGAATIEIFDDLSL